MGRKANKKAKSKAVPEPPPPEEWTKYDEAQATKLLEDANVELDKILKGDNDFLNQFLKEQTVDWRNAANPPDLVVKTLCAVMTALEKTPTLGAFMRELDTDARGLLASIKNFNKDTISDRMLQRVGRFTKDPSWRPENVSEACESVIASILCQWVHAIKIYGEVVCTGPRVEKVKFLLKHYDANGDGTIDRSELGQLLKDLDPEKWDDASIDNVLNIVDVNEDEVIDYIEFMNWVFSDLSIYNWGATKSSNMGNSWSVEDETAHQSRLRTIVHYERMEKLGLGSLGHYQSLMEEDMRICAAGGRPANGEKDA